MSKFKLRVKKFPLAFMGEGWEEAYINFRPFTLGDIRHKFPKIAKLQTVKDAENKEGMSEAVEDGLTVVIDLLKEKFESGKAPSSETGELVDIAKNDLEEFDSDLIGEAFAFLSPNSPQN